MSGDTFLTHIWVCSVTPLCPSLCNPMGGLQPARLLCSRDFPGKNTGVGCHFLLQGIFPTQGLNPCCLWYLHCTWILYCCAVVENTKSRIKLFGLNSHLLILLIYFRCHNFPKCGMEIITVLTPRVAVRTKIFKT